MPAYPFDSIRLAPSSTQDEIRVMHARKMVMEQQRLDAEKERALKKLPKLMVNTIQPMGKGVRCRFSVKNIGFGYAINLEASEILNDGMRAILEAVADREYIGIGETSNWDIPNARLGQQRTIETKYNDIPGEHFKH